MHGAIVLHSLAQLTVARKVPQVAIFPFRTLDHHTRAFFLATRTHHRCIWGGGRVGRRLSGAGVVALHTNHSIYILSEHTQHAEAAAAVAGEAFTCSHEDLRFEYVQQLQQQGLFASMRMQARERAQIDWVDQKVCHFSNAFL